MLSQFFESNMGLKSLSDQTIASLNFIGLLTIKDCIFTGKLEVKGTLTASDSTINTLNMTGNTHLDNVNITLSSTLTGLLKAKKSHFNSETLVFSELTELSDCTTSDIQIKSDKTAELILERCTIAGNIKFNGPAGIIRTDEHTVIQGVIEHAQVIRSFQHHM